MFLAFRAVDASSSLLGPGECETLSLGFLATDEMVLFFNADVADNDRLKLFVLAFLSKGFDFLLADFSKNASDVLLSDAHLIDNSDVCSVSHFMVRHAAPLLLIAVLLFSIFFTEASQLLLKF